MMSEGFLLLTHRLKEGHHERIRFGIGTDS